VLLGALLAGLAIPPRRLAPVESSTPLVVEFIPFDRASQSPATAVRSRPDSSPKDLASKVDPAVGSRSAANESKSTPDAAARAVAQFAPASTAEAASAHLASDGDADAYRQRLYELIARNCRYPADAKKLRLSGVTQLAFRVERSGAVLESWIQESSGSDLLDDAALDALARTAPLPPIPANLPSRLDFVIEIDLSLLQQQYVGRGR
jgi:protein TonB